MADGARWLPLWLPAGMLRGLLHSLKGFVSWARSEGLEPPTF